MGGALPDGVAMPADGSLPESVAMGSRHRTLSAYVHIPFCAHRCGYCDFNTYTSSELRGVTHSSFLDSLREEIRRSTEVLNRAGAAPRELASVFIGGGTPSLLPAASLTHILSVLRNEHGFNPHAEITVEANPDTLTSEYLHELARGGVTRVSIGMQSAVPAVLNVLERTHNPDNVAHAVTWAKDAGLAVSVDVIYGTPGESLGDWNTTLDAISDMALQHVSAYSLIVEEGTAMARKIRSGAISQPDPDLQAEMYERADQRFGELGLRWYEISNWSASAATESVHNRAYWTGQDWWGYGPGAHSHIGGVRFWNAKHPAAYTGKIAESTSPALAFEILSPEDQFMEKVLLETRLRDGLSATGLDRDVLAQLQDEELIELRPSESPTNDNSTVVLTLKGRLLADDVARRLTN